MLNTKLIVLTVLISSLLTGCMSFVRTTTTTFYIPDHNKRGSIYVVSASAETNNSLEFKHYKERFEQKLAAASGIGGDWGQAGLNKSSP